MKSKSVAAALALFTVLNVALAVRATQRAEQAERAAAAVERAAAETDLASLLASSGPVPLPTPRHLHLVVS